MDIRLKLSGVQCCVYVIIWCQSLVHCLSRHKHFKINPSCYDTTIRPHEKLESCWINIGLVRSRMDCALQCAENNSCTGYTENSARECILHKQCNELTNVCILENKADISYYEKSDTFISCYNKGTWNSLKERCECSDGWVGKECERLAETCLELITYHYVDITVTVLLHPLTSPVPFRASCYLFHPNDEGLYVSTILFRNKRDLQDNYDFNKTWADYQTGYFDSKRWIGLDNLYHLLQAAGSGNTLIIRLMMEPSGLYSMFYSGFRLTNSSLGYTFSFITPAYHKGADRPFYAKENITVQDCLTPIQGIKFSTFDNDNDEDASENCAALAGNGWWFKSCEAECNFFGKAYTVGGTEAPFSNQHIRIGGIDMQRYAQNFKAVNVILQTLR